MRKILSIAFGVLIAATPAMAQPSDHPVGFNFGFGWMFPASGFNDAFNTGWNGSLGATWNFNPNFGFNAEYMYADMGGPERTISVVSNPVAGAATNGLLESSHNMHVGTFNLVGKSHNLGVFNGYGIGGLGIYHRTVEITSPSVGYTTYCDPYWYVCYPTLVEVDRIIGDRSSNDFGINIGGGLTFGHEGKFFVEARYHYVWGPDITPANGSTSAIDPTGTRLEDFSSNGQYFPLTFGFRW
jgi:opacity protein-like surface antigen